MSLINAPSLQDTQYSGEAPAAHAHGYITLASVPSGHKIRLVRLFAGTKIHDGRMVNAALGGSTTVSLGFEYVDGQAGGGAAALIPATNTASAANTPLPGAPVTLVHDAFITATIGGATATGALNVTLAYEFVGK